MSSALVALSETDRFSVINLFEDRGLMPAERAVRCGGRRVKGSRARISGAGKKLYNKLASEIDTLREKNFAPATQAYKLSTK